MGHEVFISYRRDFGAERAESVYDKLKDDFNVFWDKEALLAGSFTKQIKEAIESCEYFIVILSKGFFDRCKNLDDVVRLELKAAVGDTDKTAQEISPKKRVIIPIFIDEYKNIINFSKEEQKKVFADEEFFEIVDSVLESNGVNYDETKTQYWGQGLKSLILNKFAQTSACRESLEKHYKKLANECGTIKYFGTDLEFKDVYVEQMLESVPDREESGGMGGKSGGILKPLSLLDKSGVDVIMGSAGSGKSLIVKSIALEVLKKPKTKALEKGFELPVYIELREYRNAKNKHDGAQHFLKSYIDEKLFGSASGRVDQLTGNVKWVLLFDGIDELANLVDFEAIKKDIEDFVIDQKTCKVIFASRATCSLVEGNNKFSVNGEKINKYKVRDLGDGEQAEYIDKYFNASGIKEGEPVEVTEKKKEEFKSALKKAEEKDKKFIELSRSPFLLAQIIKIYRAGGALSENKIDIYNECAKLLVDDKKFDILPDELKERNTILDVLGHLAYTLYTAETAAKDNKQKVVGLSSKDVKKEIEGYMGYLFKKDEKISATYTEKFFEYVKRCSIYTDDRFLHQTFEEYFTACHLYSAARQKESVKVGLKILEKVTIDDAVIDEIITQYKGSEYWKAIVEMLILYIDSKIEEKDTAKIGASTGEEVNLIGYLFDRLLGATEIKYDWNESQYDWFCGVAVKTANNRKAAFTSLTKSLLIRAIEGKANPYREMFFYVPVYRMYSGVILAFESLKGSRTAEEIEMAGILCGEIFEYYTDDMDEGEEKFFYTRSEGKGVYVKEIEKKLADWKAGLNEEGISFFGLDSYNATCIFISKDFQAESRIVSLEHCKKIIVDPKNKSVAIKDKHLYSSDFKTLIKFCGGLRIETFTAPETVTSIGNNAFSSCSVLTSITLPNVTRNVLVKVNLKKTG